MSGNDRDPGDNIIRLDITTELSEVERERGPCSHPRKYIDREKRRLYCADCDDDLDPMDTLLSVTGEIRGWEISLKRTREDARKAADRLLDLKRQEKNARSRLSKAVAKDPVEEFKAELMSKLAHGIDVCHDKGEHMHIGTLRGIEHVAIQLLQGRSLQSFVNKVNAAISEIEAREKRKRMRVVGAQPQKEDSSGRNFRKVT